MIKSFKHKGLKKFYETGSTAGIQPKHKNKLKLILSALNAATDIDDIKSVHSFETHPLKGDLNGQWAVSVNGNWRVFFEFKDGDAYIVNYDDYH